MPLRRRTTLIWLGSIPLAAAIGARAGTAMAKPKPQPRGPKAVFPLDQFGPADGDNVALQWNEQTLASIRAAAPAPTVVSRVLAIVQTSVYDAWAAYDPVAVGTRLGGALRRPPEERTLDNKSAAISFATFRALLDLFPAHATDLRAFMTDLGYDPGNTATDNSPAGVGNRAAAAVLTSRHQAGSNKPGDLTARPPSPV